MKPTYIPSIVTRAPEKTTPKICGIARARNCVPLSVAVDPFTAWKYIGR